MKPVEFEGYKTEIAKNQPEYLTLPAHVTKDGEITSCWELTDDEIQEIIKTKRIYFSVSTFNKPLQPQRPSVENPVKEDV